MAEYLRLKQFEYVIKRCGFFTWCSYNSSICSTIQASQAVLKDFPDLELTTGTISKMSLLLPIGFSVSGLQDLKSSLVFYTSHCLAVVKILLHFYDVASSVRCTGLVGHTRVKNRIKGLLSSLGSHSRYGRRPSLVDVGRGLTSSWKPPVWWRFCTVK